jgi:hypothetical protein
MAVGMTVGAAGVRGGKPAWSVALLLASCLVSKGIGVDGVRDSLAVRLQDQVSVSKKNIRKTGKCKLCTNEALGSQWTQHG